MCCLTVHIIMKLQLCICLELQCYVDHKHDCLRMRSWEPCESPLSDVVPETWLSDWTIWTILSAELTDGNWNSTSSDEIRLRYSSPECLHGWDWIKYWAEVNKQNCCRFLINVNLLERNQDLDSVLCVCLCLCIHVFMFASIASSHWVTWSVTGRDEADALLKGSSLWQEGETSHWHCHVSSAHLLKLLS